MKMNQFYYSAANAFGTIKPWKRGAEITNIVDKYK
jgi:hypothetical protein